MTAPLKFKQQFDVFLQLMDSLQKPKNLEQLMDELSVTQRTVYRYIDHLEEMGFKVERGSVFKKRVFRIIGENPTMAVGCLKMFQMCVPKELRP